jgi:hypothetical protein
MNAHFFNRRLFFRRAVNEAAWIEKVPSILERCTLVNVCEIGARLTIGDVYDLPRELRAASRKRIHARSTVPSDLAARPRSRCGILEASFWWRTSE